MKVVINSGYGAFGLSDEAHILYAKLKGYNLIKAECFGYQTFFKNEVKDEHNDDWGRRRRQNLNPEVFRQPKVLDRTRKDGRTRFH